MKWCDTGRAIMEADIVCNKNTVFKLNLSQYQGKLHREVRTVLSYAKCRGIFGELRILQYSQRRPCKGQNMRQ